MTEALRRLLRFAFAELRYPVIRAAAAPANRASIRVQEKLGFRPAGRGVEHAPARGGPIEVELRILPREAFADSVPVVLVAAVALLAFCSRAGLRASRWRGCGSSRVERCRRARAPRRH